jgi:hypothetical protein
VAAAKRTWWNCGYTASVRGVTSVAMSMHKLQEYGRMKILTLYSKCHYIVKMWGVLCSKSMVNHWLHTFPRNHEHCYVNDILNLIFNQLTDEERRYGYYRQDNATAHTANAIMVAIREPFQDKIIITRLCNSQVHKSVFAIFIFVEIWRDKSLGIILAVLKLCRMK